MQGGTSAAKPVVFEEERTRQRSVFTVLRLLLNLFRSSQDPYLGLYGAFGYGLAFQFEAPQLRLPRNGAQQLYYDFSANSDGVSCSTREFPRVVSPEPFRLAPVADTSVRSDHAVGEYEATVRKALQYFGSRTPHPMAR